MGMRRISLAIICVTAALIGGGMPAEAGVYSDDLSKCLVSSSSSNDQIALMQWMFSAFALHPAVQPFSTITPAQRTDLNRKAAQLMQRLLVENCRMQAVAALKYEGPTSMEAAFATLGQVAARGLMGDPQVGAGLGEMNTMLDKDKLNGLATEAGIAPVFK